jgi:sirohydrochlorin cobaltochelatase
MPTRALILAGHGSHISADTAGLVWRYVDTLRSWGVADEITAGFWKELPSFHQVLDTVCAPDVTVVPVFTAQGYFTRTVIPAEMGLDGPLTQRGARTIRYARTLGEHPYLAHIIRQRVVDALDTAGALPEETAVALIGHGTRRDDRSRESTLAQAQTLRASGIVAEVVAVYLDDTPAIPDMFTLTTAPVLIAVPFFLAPGSHVTQDVPRALGLADGQSAAMIQGRRVYYTPPVGTDESICELLLELANETGCAFQRRQTAAAWAHFPAAGQVELIEVVTRAGELPFGQLVLTPTDVRPAACDPHPVTLTIPGELRAHVREAPFRPLATRRDLPRDWHVPLDSPAMLPAVVETVYPGAVAAWAAQRQGRLRRIPPRATIARQTGIFRPLAGLSASQIAHITHTVCGRCVQNPQWSDQMRAAENIPCPEVCNFWLTAAKEQTQ